MFAKKGSGEMKYRLVYTIILAQALIINNCISQTNTTVNAITTNDSNNIAPRVIIITDFPPLDVIAGKGGKPGDPLDKLSDPDDVQSMVRFLLYSNELDVEALIAAAGTFANIARKQNLLDMIDLYEQVQPNLAKHDPRYPTADKLRSVTWQGLDGTLGTEDFAERKYRPIESLIGPEFDTEASDAIIRVIDKPDPRPVWVCVWGGPHALAQAIWKVQNTRTPEEVDTFTSKIKIFMILKQDYTAEWLLENFPKMLIITSMKNYMGMFWNSGNFKTELVDSAWTNKNIREGHGPLGAAYPRSGWDPEAPGIWEGDTPSFLHIISGLRGLNDPDKPDQAGWGGKFIRTDSTKNHWVDDPMGPKAVYMWRAYYQEEFKKRADRMLP
ncbi:MAG: DUF1593 domain-containing protein [Ignavibacteriae bacterium]|nr:DUF1593 domain-containing protein [Ignavibacteriota bacterium]